jgi:hypothetical protein
MSHWKRGFNTATSAKFKTQSQISCSGQGFGARFINKEALGIKFDQLVTLRNCIRHSRKTDEIALKEGEAAVLWFEQVLWK